MRFADKCAICLFESGGLPRWPDPGKISTAHCRKVPCGKSGSWGGERREVEVVSPASSPLVETNLRALDYMTESSQTFVLRT